MNAKIEKKMADKSLITNGMSVDVEDYFQVQAFADIFERKNWENQSLRVEDNMRKILDLFASHEVKATFFTLGWIAKRFPELMRRIVTEGHELASHGLEHKQVFTQSPDEFRQDIRTSKHILEDTGGCVVTGYRAATFSINDKTPWAHEILAEEGFLYSSSKYPISHDLYGETHIPRFAYLPKGQRGVPEIPISTCRLFGKNLPCGGGGYFRLLPYIYSKMTMRSVNHFDKQPCIFYFHPWEIDPGQPYQSAANSKSKFRHYSNQKRMLCKLDKVLKDFNWGRMDHIAKTLHPMTQEFQ